MKQEKDIFEDIEYICQSTDIISESLKKGCDVAQLPNGEIVITEVKIVSTQYAWDAEKKKFYKRAF